MAHTARAATPPSSTKYSLRINNFDLIRLLAASQVLATHLLFYLKLEPSSTIGRFLFFTLLNFPGVPIFFVISGFLISLSWERNSSLKTYVTNRCLRLFPALWTCLAVTILVMLGSGYLTAAVFHLQEFLTWVFWQSTIYQTYTSGMLQGFPTAGNPNGSLWSIPIEMQFYILLPMLYLILPRSRSGFLWGLIGITALLALTSEWIVKTQNMDNRLGFGLLMVSCLPYAYMFLLGVIIQRCLPILMPVLRGMLLPWLIFYLCTTLGLHYLGGWQTGVRLGTNTPPIFASVIIAMMTISAAYTWPTVSDRLLRGNDISYGTYIYHQVFINLVLYLEIAVVAWQIIIVVLATYTCAILSWLFIEKPSLSLKQKTLRRTSSPIRANDK